MKTRSAFLILTALLFCLYACKKDGKTNPGSIVGKWNIVSLSTYGVNYTGQPGDYYDFTADGTLHTKEGTGLSTYNYTFTKMPGDSTITMTIPGNTEALPLWGRITTFTAHSLIINGPYPVSPGGSITVGNSIILSR
jgi:hypothetical protein